MNIYSIALIDMCQKGAALDSQNDQRPKIRSKSILQKGLYIDEALSKIKFGVLNYLLIFLSALIILSTICEIVGIVYVFPASQCDMNLTSSEKGILGGAVPLCIICSCHLWGYLADTKGRRAVILPSLFIAFFLSVAASLVQNIYAFTILRFLNGFFIAGSSATILAYLCEFNSNAKRSRAIMGAALIFCISCPLMPLIAWSVINQDWHFHVPLFNITYKPWRFYFVVCILPEIIVGMVLLFIPESPKFVLGQGDKEGAKTILQKIKDWNGGEDLKLDTVDLFEEIESIDNRQRILDCKNSRFPLLKLVWIQTAPLFNSTYLRSTLLICLMQFGNYATCNGFFMFFGQMMNKMALNLNDFVNDRMYMCDAINMEPINSTRTDLVKMDERVCVEKLELETLEQGVVIEIIYAVSQVVVSLIIEKVGKFSIIFFVMTFCGACAIACVVVDIPIVQIYAFSILMSSGLALNVVNSIAVESYPTAFRAMAMSMSSMSGRLGSVVGTNVAAQLLDNHCSTVFYLSATSMFMMAIMAFFIPNIHKKSTNVETARQLQRLSVISFRGVRGSM